MKGAKESAAWLTSFMSNIKLTVNYLSRLERLQLLGDKAGSMIPYYRKDAEGLLKLAKDREAIDKAIGLEIKQRVILSLEEKDLTANELVMRNKIREAMASTGNAFEEQIKLSKFLNETEKDIIDKEAVKKYLIEEENKLIEQQEAALDGVMKKIGDMKIDATITPINLPEQSLGGMVNFDRERMALEEYDLAIQDWKNNAASAANYVSNAFYDFFDALRKGEDVWESMGNAVARFVQDSIANLMRLQSQMMFMNLFKPAYSYAGTGDFVGPPTPPIVESSMGGGGVVVNLNNTTGLPMTATASQKSGGMGKVIDIMIENAVNKNMSNGKHDSMMASVFGTKRKGIRR